jgi:hypothetical protein
MNKYKHFYTVLFFVIVFLSFFNCFTFSKDNPDEKPIFFSTYYDPAVYGNYEPMGVGYIVETVDESILADPTESALKSLFEKAVDYCKENHFAGIINISIVFEKPFGQMKVVLYGTFVKEKQG